MWHLNPVLAKLAAAVYNIFALKRAKFFMHIDDFEITVQPLTSKRYTHVAVVY